MAGSPVPIEVGLRDYIDRIFDERQRAVDVTAAALSHRLDTLNCLREEVVRDREMFLPRNVYDQMHTDLVRRVSKVESMQSRIVGVGITLIVVSGLTGAFIGAMLTHLMK